MTQQIIGIGIVADDGTGDNLRSAFNKCNLNFTELYGGGGGAGGALGGGIRAAVLTTTPTLLVPSSSLRQSISFHNPGSINLYVAPAAIVNFDNTVSSLTPSLAALQGCLIVFPGALLRLTGAVQGSWQAFAASGTTPITIQDSNQ